MLKKLVIIFTVLCLIPINTSAQNKNGLLINGGLGNIRSNIRPAVLDEITDSNIKYKSNFSIGYRFRAYPSKSSFFFDLDANFGVRLWKSSYIQSVMEPPMYEASTEYYFLSLGGIANYPVYKGLIIGAGIEPTYYIRQDGENSKNKFDTPLVGKIAYNFGILELGISYKLGLFNTIKTNYLKSGKFSDWQLSVWIPF